MQLEPDVVQTLDSLYPFYPRQWWCYVFKVHQALINGLALLVVAAGMIVGSKNTIVVTSLTTSKTVIKGWTDIKKFSVKVGTYQFAYTMHAKTLTELRNYVLTIVFTMWPWKALVLLVRVLAVKF